MEKLLKLLNEYVGEEYLYVEIDLQEGIRDNFFHNKEGDHEIEESYVISKKFGFIKWLVDNDKIKGFEFYLGDASLEIIQRLSISDEPIDLLISLLK